MPVVNALASLAVDDLAAARTWYEALLGPGSQPMDEVVEWSLEGGGGVQIYSGTDRAGGCSCTFVIDDIDSIAALLGVEVQRNDRVDTVMVKDPDGNSIAFALAKDPTLVR